MSDDTKGSEETYNRLREAYATLKSEKDSLAGQIKQLEEAIEELESELKREFGTADPKQLQLLLAERTAENNDKCQKYELHLNEVKQKLADLKQEVDDNDTEDSESEA
jgi:chromosome segregation ATPase